MAGGEGIISAGRRTFLKWATGASAFLSAALAGIPVLRAFVSPAFRRATAETWIKLGDVATFDLDIPTKVDFVETVTDAWVENRVLRGVWVYTDDGEHFTVYSGRCTHLGCGFGLEKVTGHCLEPLHRPQRTFVVSVSQAGSDGPPGWLLGNIMKLSGALSG